MIGRLVTSNPARRECYYINKRSRLKDPRVNLDDLPLYRIATSDFSFNRVFDRMLMYERRIENSLHKTMRELERRQLIQQFQQQDAEQEHQTQEPNQLAKKKVDLKNKANLKFHIRTKGMVQEKNR